MYSLSSNHFSVNQQQVAAVTEVGSAVIESQTAEAVKTVEEVAALSEVESTSGSLTTDVIESRALKEQEEIVPTVVIPEDIVVPTDAVEVVVPLYQQELVQDALPTPVSELVVSARLAEQAEVIPTQSSGSEASVTVFQQEVTQEAAPTPAEEITVEKVAEEVNNIADAINFLEKEVKAVEVSTL